MFSSAVYSVVAYFINLVFLFSFQFYFTPAKTRIRLGIVVGCGLIKYCLCLYFSEKTLGNCYGCINRDNEELGDMQKVGKLKVLKN